MKNVAKNKKNKKYIKNGIALLIKLKNFKNNFENSLNSFKIAIKIIIKVAAI